MALKNADCYCREEKKTRELRFKTRGARVCRQPGAHLFLKGYDCGTMDGSGQKGAVLQFQRSKNMSILERAELHIAARRRRGRQSATGKKN